MADWTHELQSAGGRLELCVQGSRRAGLSCAGIAQHTTLKTVCEKQDEALSDNFLLCRWLK